MALDAVLFDVDGTLLDTNALHIEAWGAALQAHGYRLGGDRIAVEIGKGGDKLVPSLLGQAADERDGESLRAAHGEIFSRLVRTRGVTPIAGALPLLAAVRRRGLKVALVTSGRAQQLRMMQEAAGVDLDSACDVIVTADDAQQSKPAPDLVAAATARLRLSPAQCAMVGDTLYDMKSAKLAGVVGLGVLTGYQPRQSLLHSGARAVYADAAALLAQLDAALRCASPSAMHLTTAVLEALMGAALAEAERGYAAGEAPIGCVLADGHGQLVAGGHNQCLGLLDRTAHAEVVAFRHAAGKIPDDATDCILVSTLEPCVMCTGAAMEAAIDTIVYALPAPADSGTGRVHPPQSPQCQMPRIVGGVLAEQSRELFQRFYRTAQHPLQRAFTEQLLALTSTVAA